MKFNKLTPGQNLQWESSRMMLPEHREALLKQKKDHLKRSKPDLDDQFTRIVGYAMAEAHQLQTTVNVTVFDEDESRVYTGVITRIDLQLRQIKLDQETDDILIKMDDILLIDGC